MKHILIFLLLPVSVFAAEAAPQPVVPAQSAAQAAPKWEQTRDAFLSFTLDKAKDYTGKAEAVINKAIDATEREAPLLIKEYLHWKLAYNLTYGLLPLFALIACVILFIKQWPKWKVSYYEGFPDRLTPGNGLNVFGTILGAA